MDHPNETVLSRWQLLDLYTYDQELCHSFFGRKLVCKELEQARAVPNRASGGVPEAHYHKMKLLVKEMWEFAGESFSTFNSNLQSYQKY